MHTKTHPADNMVIKILLWSNELTINTGQSVEETNRGHADEALWSVFKCNSV